MTGRTSVPAGLTIGGLPPAELLRRTWAKVSENGLMLQSSAAAYYALTALVPFIAVVVPLAVHLAPDVNAAPGSRAALGGMTVDEFRLTLSRVLPEEAYKIVAEEIARIQKQPPVGLLSVGLVVSLWLSSSLFGTIIEAMNRILGLPETRPYWRLVLMSVALTAVEAVIILGSMILLAVWPEVRGWFVRDAPAGFLETGTEWAIVLAATLLSFAVVRSYGPSVHRGWRWVTPGGALGTAALMASVLLLRLYIRYFGNYEKTYGSLAGVMLLALWFWVAAMILLLAVQVDKILEDAREHRP